MYMPTTLSFVLVVVDAVWNFTITHFCIVSQPLLLPMFKMLSIPVGTGNIYQFDIQLGRIPCDFACFDNYIAREAHPTGFTGR